MNTAKRWLVGLLIIIGLVASGPLLMLASDEIRLGTPWHAADRSTAGLAPAAADTPQAVVQVYAARAFSWRGLFAVHTWVATKPAGAQTYTVHQVTGWNSPALTSRIGMPDRRWVGATPDMLLDLRGPVAEQAIRSIEKVLPQYPFPDYRIWPGPNSNTFTAWLVRRVPELQVELPSTAIGKDYLAGDLISAAPSGTGYQLSLYGAVGLLIAWDEGIEINLFGLVWGINPTHPALKWPGLGTITSDDIYPREQEL
ncbi:hypothetical protein SADO_12199 [Salinisphaera dokdonensis CL-ES53]|uniref:DUF3750 domain-containing protein n=1 Tax=Salinisphaera dokdonensis CL-ES53 TaxID=1304272 RepID=A0ABV2B2A2_9GAMM